MHWTSALRLRKKEVDALKDRSAYEASAAKNAAELARRQDLEVRNQQAAAQDASISLQQAGINQRLQLAALGREREQVELEKGYEQGKVSLGAYIDAEYALRKRALQDQLAAVGQEAALLKLKPPTTPEEVTAQSAKQLDILNRRYAIEANLVKLQEQFRVQPQAFEPANVKASIHTPQEDFNASEHSAATQQAIAEAIRSQDEAASAFTKTLKEQQAATDKEVDALNAETASLGMSSIEKAKALAISKLQAQADKDALLPGADKAKILAAQTAETEKLTAAMDLNYAASRSFSVGAQTAFQSYQDNAANAAKFAENTIGSGLDQLTDAITKFEETGKLSFRSLFVSMAEDFLKQLVRMQVAAAASSVLKYLGFAVGAGDASAAGAGAGAADAAASGISFGATGSNNIPKDGLMYVHKGEALVPASYNPALHGGSSNAKTTVIVNAPPGTKVDKTQESHGSDGHQVEVFMSMGRAADGVEYLAGSRADPGRAQEPRRQHERRAG